MKKSQRPKPEACIKCGRCCLNKALMPNGKGFLTGGTCRYQDQDTNLCLIYPWRHKHNPACASIDMAVKLQLLPQDCACVKNVKKYKSKLNYSMEVK